MRNANVAYSEIAEQSFVPPGRAFREIEVAPPEDLLIADLVELYVNIEASLGHRRRLAIQFACMSPGGGKEEIALELAWAGSSVLGKRVLLLTSAGPTLYPEPGGLDRGDASSNSNFLNWNKEFVRITGQQIYLGDLRGWRTRTGSLISTNDIDRHLDELSLFFDMILIAPPPLDRDPLGTVLARHVDGSIIVIEAEETRQFSAIRLREILARSGQPIVGAILNGRRNYIPRWLARLL